MRPSWWLRAVRVALAVTLATAAAGKLLDPTTGLVTPRIVAADHPLHALLTTVESMAPYLELLTSAALLTGFGLLAGSLASTCLCAVFVAYAVLLTDGDRCHCFGVFGGFGTRRSHLLVTASLLVLSVVLLWNLCSRTMRPKDVRRVEVSPDLA